MGSKGSYRHDSNFAFPWLDDAWTIGPYKPCLVLPLYDLLDFDLRRWL